MKLIHDEWWTRFGGKTDAGGSVTFRGFFGHYRLTAGGKTVEFDLTKDSPVNLEITLN